MSRTVATFESSGPKARASLGLAGLCALLAACEGPTPRTFMDFMDDRIAREGTLAYCNENPDETVNDLECANARRATATIALRLERERRAELERESERKLKALRLEMAERERIVRESTLAAARAEREAYEALWSAASGSNLEGSNAEGSNAEALPPVGPPVSADRLSLIEPPSGLRENDSD